MKIKNGKIKLEPGEKRIGNFVIKDEKEHMKLFDINQVFTHRARKDVPIGMFLEDAYKTLDDEKVKNGLGNWIAVIFTAFSVVPDMKFLEEVYAASEACMKRQPEAYGMTPDGTDAENDEAAKEVKEMMEFEQEVKNLPDDKPAPKKKPATKKKPEDAA